MIKINQFFFELNFSTQKRIITYHKKEAVQNFGLPPFCDLYEALLLT